MKVLLILFIPILALTGCNPTQSNTNNYLSDPTSTPLVTNPAPQVSSPAPTEVTQDDLLKNLNSESDLNFDAEFDALARDLQ
ncbi:MAG: hypothetical protein WCT01_02330 [Candidatus Shapirobacteria bacterium]|jgi:hypothetical protein